MSSASLSRGTAFSNRRLLADDRINSFYSGVDIETLMRKQKVFLTHAFGGINRYPGKSIRTAHEPLVMRGLSTHHFEILLSHLQATREEFGFHPRLRTEVLETINHTRTDVLNQTHACMDSTNPTHHHPDTQGATIMKRIAFFTYGVVSYAIFFATFCDACGWLLVLASTFQINHFDLFGLSQVWLYLRGRPYAPLQFRTPFLYRFVRHSLYVGWFFALWATPTMSATHLLFAIVTSAYILVAIQLKERNLADALPEYREYRTRIPMLIPFTRRRPVIVTPQPQPETAPATMH